MKINELINAVADLVKTREIIDHGSIRMLYSDLAVDAITSVEECDEVSVGTIGDDDLAQKLSELADDGSAIAELDLDELWKLESKFFGEHITEYIDSEKEDELQKLDALIDAAKEIV